MLASYPYVGDGGAPGVAAVLIPTTAIGAVATNRHHPPSSGHSHGPRARDAGGDRSARLLPAQTAIPMNLRFTAQPVGVMLGPGRRFDAVNRFETAEGRWTPVSYTHLRAHETPEHLVC